MLAFLSSSIRALQPLATSSVCMKLLAMPRLKNRRSCAAAPISMMRLALLYLALDRARIGMRTLGSRFFLADSTTDCTSSSSLPAVSLLRLFAAAEFRAMALLCQHDADVT